jgi:hypothetical protein
MQAMAHTGYGSQAGSVQGSDQTALPAMLLCPDSRSLVWRREDPGVLLNSRECHSIWENADTAQASCRRSQEPRPWSVSLFLHRHGLTACKPTSTINSGALPAGHWSETAKPNVRLPADGGVWAAWQVVVERLQGSNSCGVRSQCHPASSSRLQGVNELTRMAPSTAPGSFFVPAVCYLVLLISCMLSGAAYQRGILCTRAASIWNINAHCHH